MSYLNFKNQFYDLVCFTIHQVYAWKPHFDRNNITRWIKKGYLIRLRQGYYTFSEYKNNIDAIYYFANRIYLPSYISLHTALSYYEMIPESIIQITSVSTLKTIDFTNEMGQFSYKSIKKSLFTGFEFKKTGDDRTIQFACPEKALFDLFYFYSFYNSEKEIEDLRLNEDFLQNDFNYSLFQEYAILSKNKSLQKKVKKLKKVYSL